MQMLEPGACSNFADLLRDIMPSFLCCCERSRNNRAFALARQRLAVETSIIEMIKNKRYVNAALK